MEFRAGAAHALFDGGPGRAGYILPALRVAHPDLINLAVFGVSAADSNHAQFRSIAIQFSEQPVERMVVGAHHQKSGMCGGGPYGSATLRGLSYDFNEKLAEIFH